MAEYKFLNETVTVDPTGATSIKPITLDQLKPVESINLPTQNVNFSQPDSLVAGVNSSMGSLDSFLKSIQPQETQLDQSQNAIISRLNELLPQSGGKQMALAQEQQRQGIPDLQKQLTDLNNQINIGNSSYAKLVADAEAKKAALEANSAGITTSVLAGQQGAVERQALAERAVKAAELGMLAARAQAVSGNINTAIQLAENAVTAKYAPIEDELRIRQAQLDAIQPLLNKQEKQQAQKQQLLIDERNRILAENKEREKAIQNITLEAARFGADEQTMSRLQNSRSLGDAISIATPYLSAEFKQKVEQQKFENNLQLQQLAVSRGNLALSQRRQAFEEAQSAGLLTPDGQVSPELLAYAQQYAADGKIPTGMPKGSFGVVSQIAKDLPKQPGTLVDRYTGIAPTGDSTKINAYTNLYSTIELAKQLKELDKNRWGGVTAGLTGKIFGSESQQRYIDLRAQIVDLIARARTGAAINANEEKMYSKMLPGRYDEPFGLGADSDKRIDNFISSLSSDLNNKLAASGLAIYGLSKVKLSDGKEYKVGDVISNGEQEARVNPDGSLTIIQ